MKKIKWIFMSLALIVSVCGAFATRPHYDCSFDTQYYFNGNGYNPAGTYGVTYICQQSSQTCTYTKSGLNYIPCQQGAYTPAPGLRAKEVK
jgi:hypothetical protein